jgi:hypothetical protein
LQEKTRLPTINIQAAAEPLANDVFSLKNSKSVLTQA